MTDDERVQEIRDRLRAAGVEPGGSVRLMVHAPEDIAWLLDRLAAAEIRTERLETLAGSLQCEVFDLRATRTEATCEDCGRTTNPGPHGPCLTCGVT